MHSSHNQSRGFSLVELLVVVTIVGMLSLVTVPAFMNLMRSNSLRSSVSAFTGDIRNCRQRAITRNSRVLLELDSTTAYRFWESTDNGSTFAPLSIAGTGATPKSLDKVVYFAAETFTADFNAKDAILFMPDGTAAQPDGSSTPASVTLQTAWANVSQNKFVITIGTTGKLKVDGSHT